MLGGGGDNDQPAVDQTNATTPSSATPTNRKRSNPWAEEPVNVLKARQKLDEEEQQELYAATVRRMLEASRTLPDNASKDQSRHILPLPGRANGTGSSQSAANSSMRTTCGSCGTLNGIGVAESDEPTACYVCDRRLCADCAKECEDCGMTFCPTCSFGRFVCFACHLACLLLRSWTKSNLDSLSELSRTNTRAFLPKHN